MSEPTMTYLEAKNRLEEIAKQLQSGGVDLQTALELHAEAKTVRKVCEDFIANAAQEITAAGVAA